MPKTRAAISCQPRASSNVFAFPVCRACALTPAWSTDPRSAPFTTRCWQSSSSTLPRATKRRRRLARALAASQIHGLRTNRDLLVRILEHPEFLVGRDRHAFSRAPPARRIGRTDGQLPPPNDCMPRPPPWRRRPNVARRPRVAANIPSGWRNNPSQLQIAKFVGEQGDIEVGYAFHRDRARIARRRRGVERPARVDAADAGSVRLEVDGVARTYSVQRVGNTYYIDSPLGSSELKEIDRFPLADAAEEAGSLVAPLPGLVDQIKVAVGDTVAAGDTLIVIESMKMLHSVTAPVAGKVTEIRVALKSHVEAGTVLAVIEE